MFSRRNRKNVTTREEKVKEIYDDIDEYTAEEEKEEYKERKEYAEKRKVSRVGVISDIIFIIIMIALIFITVDVIAVGKYDKGPYFAIPLKTYKDGGSKAYYGIGYKVIKYNQIQGRRDKEIGTWALQYNTEPTTVQDIDLTIEFMNNEVATYKKYYKEFVRIISVLHEVDEENHQIKIGYVDEDGKYSMDIICKMVPDQDDLSTFEEGEEITIIGTVTDYESGKLTVSNCFAQQ